MNGGGTLVTIDAATTFAVRQFALPVKNVLDGVKPQDFYVPGSLLKVVLDTDHPIAYGMAWETPIFFDQDPAFEVSGAATPVATYPLTNPLMSGWILGEEKLHGRTAVADVPVGRGRVILLALRPQFRAQARVTYKLLFNSLFYSVATPGTFENTGRDELNGQEGQARPAPPAPPAPLGEREIARDNLAHGRGNGSRLRRERLFEREARRRWRVGAGDANDRCRGARTPSRSRSPRPRRRRRKAARLVHDDGAAGLSHRREQSPPHRAA